MRYDKSKIRNSLLTRKCLQVKKHIQNTVFVIHVYSTLLK